MNKRVRKYKNKVGFYKGDALTGRFWVTSVILFRNRLVKLNSDGTEDKIFVSNLGQGFNNTILAVEVQSDGKILVGGTFTSFNGNTRNRILRLNADGTEDTAFYTNLGTASNANVSGFLIQPDSKILVFGFLTQFNGVTVGRLLRLNNDGTPDTTFNTNLGTGFATQSSSIALQSDGKILVGGVFDSFNGNTRRGLVRLNSDGTEDTAFYTNLGLGFSGGTSLVDSLRIQSDGKILAGGAFTQLNFITRNRLVRLNSDGTEDTTFYTNLGTAFNSQVSSISLQSDGKIITSGAFTSFNGNTRNRLLRLNSDGTEDTTFYTNLGTAFSGATGNVFKNVIQADGKILAGGFFITFNGNTRNRLVRLNSDGTEDTAFYTNLYSGQGFPNTARPTLTDDKILAFGAFTF